MQWLVVRLKQYFWTIFQFVAFVFILCLGAYGYAASWDRADSSCSLQNWEALYRSLQLFGLNHNDDCLKDRYTLELWLARFLAPSFLVVAVISLLSGAIMRYFATKYHLHPFRRRILVLGYGPIGQAIALQLRKGTNPVAVTAVAPKVDAAMKRAAERDGVALFEDDPSDPVLFDSVRADRVARTYVALENDLSNLDAAENYKKFKAASGGAPDLRLFVEDEELASNLTDAASTGFMCGEGLRLYSAKLEAARELLQRARFDRLALAAGQPRVHVVVVGCGGQGVAVVNEVLLQCWRADLGAPVVTVIDKRSEDVKARFMRRSPALFEERLPIGPKAHAAWIPPMFFQGDMDSLDVTRLSAAFTQRLAANPPTAWVFASAEDDRNLRAGLALQTQMMRKELPAASLYVRVWAAHCRDADQLDNRIVSLTHTFGSLQNAMKVTQAFETDPDAVAKAVHSAYDDAGAAMQAASSRPKFSFYPSDWATLIPSMQESNRRLHRHAALKLNDLGLDWRDQDGFVIPAQDEELRKRFAEAEDSIDYAALTSGAGGDMRLAQRILTIAGNEHDRWTVDRAIDGWRPHPRIGHAPREQIKRDVARRRHENMAYLEDIDANTRRYDGVMLRAILNATPSTDVAARPQKRLKLDLAGSSGLCPSAFDGALLTNVTEAAVIMPLRAWKDIFKDLKIKLPNPNDRFAVHAAFDQIAGAKGIQGALEAAAKGDVLCRIVVAFCQPPDQYAIEFAEWLVKPALVASNHAVKIESYWSWPAGDGTGSFPGLVDEEATF